MPTRNQHPKPAREPDPADDFFYGPDDDDTEVEFILLMTPPADDPIRPGTSE